MRIPLARAGALALAAWLLPIATAQDAPTAETGASAEKSSEVPQEELDQMLAPLALYPDSLLSQILMACTYPLEIVEADRWTEENAKLQGDALTAALEEKEWDPSVKSLVNFPDVLASLNENLEWTRKIGDAFLADQGQVMDTVQKLRAKAKEAGNLESSDKVTVTTEPASSGSGQEIIVIESPDPKVIYVPTYDPVVVYGTWWYPHYPPPVYYRPPGYAAGAFISFGIGFAWGYAWGGCNWHHHDVDIDIHRNVNINANIDRSKYEAKLDVGGDGKGAWKHDATHRKGVAYRDQATAQRFGGESEAQAEQAREAFRGRADDDRTALSRDRAAGRIDASGRTPGVAADRAREAASSRGIDRAGTAGRAGSASGRSNAFSGTSRGSGATRDAARGRASRAGASRAGGAARGRGGRGR